MIIGAGTAISFILGIALAGVQEAKDTSLKNLKDVRAYTNLLSSGIADLDVHIIPAGKGEPEHRHFDVRYIAQTASPHAIVIDAQESKELMWFDLDRAAVVMSGEESARVIGKIRRLL